MDGPKFQMLKMEQSRLMQYAAFLRELGQANFNRKNIIVQDAN